MQKKICLLIINWQSKFTWSLLEKAILQNFNFSVTRQTLKDYHAIKKEYDFKKQDLRGVRPEVCNKIISAEKAELIKKISKLESEIDLIQATVDEQLSFIEDMITNASVMNIDLEKLIQRHG